MSTHSSWTAYDRQLRSYHRETHLRTIRRNIEVITTSHKKSQTSLQVDTLSTKSVGRVITPHGCIECNNSVDADRNGVYYPRLIPQIFPAFTHTGDRCPIPSGRASKVGAVSLTHTVANQLRSDSCGAKKSRHCVATGLSPSRPSMSSPRAVSRLAGERFAMVAL